MGVVLSAPARGQLRTTRACQARRRSIQLSHAEGDCRRAAESRVARRSRRSTSGDRGGCTRANRLPGWHDVHRRHRVAPGDGRASAIAWVVPLVPRVRDCGRGDCCLHHSGTRRARDLLPVLDRPGRSRVRDLTGEWTSDAICRRGRAPDAGSGAGEPGSACRPARGDDRSLCLHGARGLGDSACGGRGDFAERSARRRDVLARGELRVGIHPGESRSARGLEPRRRGSDWRGWRRGGPGARPENSWALLGGCWAGDLPAARSFGKSPGAAVPTEWSAASSPYAALLSTRRGRSRPSFRTDRGASNRGTCDQAGAARGIFAHSDLASRWR